MPTTSQGHAFAEILTGTKWTVREVPLPKGSTAAALAGFMRLGHALRAGGRLRRKHSMVLFESWNGKTFARMKAVSPAGQFPDVYGVSCTSAKSCVAVGSITRSGFYNQTGFAELWNGKSWSVISVKGPKNPLLTGVSCATAKSCMAVGNTSTDGSEETAHALAISYDGHWTTGNVPPLANGGTSAFSSVSCVSATDCVAVGEEVAQGARCSPAQPSPPSGTAKSGNWSALLKEFLPNGRVASLPPSPHPAWCRMSRSDAKRG